MTFIEWVQHTTAELIRLRPQLEAAMAYSPTTHTYDDVCAMVLQNRCKLWTTANSILVTEVIEYPQEKHYHMWLGGGNLGEILALHPQVIAEARRLGCAKLTVSGRRGWVKALCDHGWKETATICAKDIA